MMVSIDMQEITNGSSFWADGQLRSVGVNPGYGSGCLTRVKPLQNGVSIVIQDFSLYGDGEIRLSRDREDLPFIGFFNCFSGIGHISYTRPRIPLGSGFSNIEFGGHRPGLDMAVERNTPVRTLTVCMDPGVFEKLTGKSGNDLLEALATLDGRAGGKKDPVRSKRIDFAQKLCTSQAIASFTEAPQDAFLLEAKALELVALQLRQLEYLLGKTPERKRTAPDMDRISYACEILKNEMADPPGARELAGRVGLNHNQLVRGFRTALGIRPFEYLRTVRLEKAYQMIAGQECNITEAAFRVGYSSLSHFTKSFRQEFGITPKAHARGRKTSQPNSFRQ